MSPKNQSDNGPNSLDFLVALGNSTKLGGCVLEALKLKGEDPDNGEVYWVTKFCHAYYVPNLAGPTEMALNQVDNGYEGFPALTVEVVRKFGKLIDCSNMWDVMFDE